MFPLLASFAIANIQSNRILDTIFYEDVLRNHNLDLVELIPCIHEEVEQRLCLHAKHASKSSYFFFLTVNTDLVVIAVCGFLRLPKLSDHSIEFRLEIRWNSFPSAKSAKLSDHLYVMDNYFFMLLAIAIPHLHLVEKIKSCFLNPGKNFQR